MTLAGGGPRATSLAVGAGRILALGSERDTRPLVGRSTERVDCRGAAIVPGLVEPDPLRAPPDEVADARVRLALVGGRRVWPA